MGTQHQSLASFYRTLLMSKIAKIKAEEPASGIVHAIGGFVS